jgi:hypothetical protein
MSNVRSRIYDHLMPPPEITAEGKKLALNYSHRKERSLGYYFRPCEHDRA